MPPPRGAFRPPPRTGRRAPLTLNAVAFYEAAGWHHTHTTDADWTAPDDRPVRLRHYTRINNGSFGTVARAGRCSSEPAVEQFGEHRPGPFRAGFADDLD
jgi:hypothetical protein